MKTEEYMRGKSEPNEGQRKVDKFSKRRGGFCDKRKVHDNGKATAIELAVQGPFACVTLYNRCVAEERNGHILCAKWVNVVLRIEIQTVQHVKSGQMKNKIEQLEYVCAQE